MENEIIDYSNYSLEERYLVVQNTFQIELLHTYKKTLQDTHNDPEKIDYSVHKRMLELIIKFQNHGLIKTNFIDDCIVVTITKCGVFVHIFQDLILEPFEVSLDEENHF